MNTRKQLGLLGLLLLLLMGAQNGAGAQAVYAPPAARTASAQSFGVRADARHLTGLSVSGTALTSSTAQFVPADVGRTVCIYTSSGSSGAVDGQSTISSYGSSTSVTLAATIPTISSVGGSVGTDDTAAWQAAVNWAIGSNTSGVITYSGNGTSLIAGTPQLVSYTCTIGGATGTFNYKAQITLPSHFISTALQPMPVVEIRGDTPPSGPMAPYLTLAPNPSGLILLSTSATATGFMFAPAQPTGVALGGTATTCNDFVQFNATNVTFRKPPDIAGAFGMVYLDNAFGCDIEHCIFDVDAVIGQTGAYPASPGLSTDNGSALVMPGWGNWAFCEVRDCQVVFYCKGIAPGPHALLQNNTVQMCGAAFAPGGFANGAALDQHSVNFVNDLIQHCGTGIEPTGLRAVTGTIEFETMALYSVNDPNKYLTGTLVMGSDPPTGVNSAIEQVGSVGPGLMLSSNNGVAILGKMTPISDTFLSRVTGQVAFGAADGSNHTYVIGGGMAIDANGVYTTTPSVSTMAFASAQNTPVFTSHRMAFTVKTSPTAAKTDAGIFFWNSHLSDAAGWSVTLGNSVSFGNNGLIVANASAGRLLQTNNFTPAVSTSYNVVIYARTNNSPHADLNITGFINGTKYLDYTAHDPFASPLTTPGVTMNGVAVATSGNVYDDGGSRLTNYSDTQATDLPFVYSATVPLVAGTVTISIASLTTYAHVRVWNNGAAGTVGTLSTSVTAGQLVINSSSSSDTSTVYYEVTNW